MSFAVVIWTATGTTPLPIEEIEVISIQKLVIDGTAAPGSECAMQYQQKMWHGKISSLHEKLKDAKEASFRLEDACASSDGEEAEKEKLEVRERNGKVPTAEKKSPSKKNKQGKSKKKKDPFQSKKAEHKKESNNKGKAGDKKVSNKKEKAKKAPSEAQRKSCAQLVATITAPLTVADDSVEAIFSSSSEESDTEVNTPQLLPQLHVPSQLVRPQVGMKTPKSSFPPMKCINVHCKEEKRELKREIDSLRQEIDDLKSSSSKGPQSHSPVLTPSGEMDANEASKKGLAEIAHGVWCCAVKVKALINSVSSRTALANSMLYIFYPKDMLAGKRLKDLDSRIVGAIADFAVVAKVKERVEKNETEHNDNPKEPKKVTRGDVMQAMCQKCNQLIFQNKRPTYHKEKYEEAKSKKARLDLGDQQ